MFIPGARFTSIPKWQASLPISTKSSSTSFSLNEQAIAVPHGKRVVNLLTRRPAGPSAVMIAGTPFERRDSVIPP